MNLLNVAVIALYFASVPTAFFNRKVGYALTSATSLLFLASSIEEHAHFAAISSLIWALISLFSLSYDHYGRWLSPLYSLTIAGMTIILLSNNYLTFLAGWEVMTVSAYIVIGLNRRNSLPAFSFMLFSELSTSLILAGFALGWGETGTLFFTELPSPLPLVLCTFGFAVKMGLLPFLVSEWLPMAHGSAPSNVSALLSSTMTLMGVYGIVKVWSLTPQVPEVLGYLIMLLGSFSVFFGALYAYVSDHVKGLLAFSTIENNGSILTAIGVLFSAPTMREVAYSVVLIFALAHSLAKAGLFMVSGGINGDSLTQGGRRKSAEVIVGETILVISMSGLLPTIGGVAVWGNLEMLFAYASVLRTNITALILIAAGAMVAVGEGFATGALVKLFSFTSLFSEPPRRDERREGWTYSMLGSAALVVILGISSSSFFPLRGGAQSLGIPEGTLLVMQGIPGETFGAISPLMVTSLITLFATASFLAFGRPKVRRTRPWNNGRDGEYYTAFAFSNNVRMMLRSILRFRPWETSGTVTNVFWLILYRLGKGIATLSRKFGRTFMNGSVAWYMLYMILAFIIVFLLSVF